MINYRHLLRAIVPCLLLAAAPLLSHCGEAEGFGTETGNPPQLEEKQLYLELVAGGIRVVGTPGAIAPAGASVRVTNVSTGVSVETRAAADGSLDVVIAAEPGDELEVTVGSGGQETSARISFGAIGSRTDLGGVSCDALEATLTQTLVEVVEDADIACSYDIDCVSIPFAGVSCYTACTEAVVSRAGLADASEQAEQRTMPVCLALQSCVRPAAPRCEGPGENMRTTACEAGRCVSVDPVRVTCGYWGIPASERRTQLRAAANKQCALDTDCGVANIGVSCLFDCEYVFDGVAVSEVAALEASIRDEVEAAYCVPGAAYDCEPPNIDCTPPTGTATAVCNAGTCEVQYVGLTGG
jgi:hypothetical protein